MAAESSLSLEETNKLRIQLGLKPIVVDDKEHKILKNAVVEEPQFIAKAKISLFRKKVSELKDNLHHTSYDNDGTDWLSNISRKNGPLNKISITYDNSDEEEKNDGEELPILNVSQNIKSFVTGKDVVLTLKDTDILNDDADNDTVEHENLAMENDMKKNLKLRAMNKERIRRKMNLDVSSKDIELEEKAAQQEKTSNNILVVGSISTLTNEKEKGEIDTANHNGKIKVTFGNNEEDEDSDIGDYKPVKIKKRNKIKEQINNRKKSRVPMELENVVLIDEEDSDVENDILINIRPMKRIRENENNDNNSLTYKNHGKDEKLKRREELDRLRNFGMIIDENTAFFDSLQNATLLSKSERIVNGQNDSKKTNVSSIGEMEIESKATEKKIKSADFYSGVASTVNLLKDYNRANPVKKIAKVQEDDKEESVEKVVNLNNYNPDVQLNYKDKKGNTLTTKEAYKLLSQKFHGTKSNKQKRQKFEKKIQERNRVEPE